MLLLPSPTFCPVSTVLSLPSLYRYNQESYVDSAKQLRTFLPQFSYVVPFYSIIICFCFLNLTSPFIWLLIGNAAFFADFRFTMQSFIPILLLMRFLKYPTGSNTFCNSRPTQFQTPMVEQTIGDHGVRVRLFPVIKKKTIPSFDSSTNP